MLLSNVAIRNRTTVLVMVVLIIVTGVYSYITLPRESAPDVKLPNILITTPHQGVTPRDVENTVTNKIEQEIRGVKGLDEIRSVTAEGLSQINVEFQTDVDIDDALQRIKDKVDLARPELPVNSDKPVEPVVSEINIAEFPIMLINLSGPVSPVRLKLIAEALEDEIEVLPGVLEVIVSGTLEREIVIEIDPDRLAQYGLSTVELLKIVPSQHVNQSAGGLETSGTKFNIRVPMEVTQPDEIDKFPLAVRDGKQIYLSDIARVRDTFKDRETYSRLDGESSVTIAVKKRVGANIVEIAMMVKAVLAEARKHLPPGVTLELTDDRSKEIDSMVLDLENNILTGLILVVGVLMIFMGLRSSLIVATVIPLSMLMSFAAILAMGYTLNMVVLFALILALGMLVDNAIVIVENVYRFMEMGYSRVEAAMKGTAEVAWPVITSTLTTVAAFVPLLYWPGIMGEFMRYIPITVITVLTASLLVALMINPVICSVFAKPGKKKLDPHHKPGLFKHGYRRMLETALGHPGITLALCVLLLAAVLIVYGRQGRGMELFPAEDPDQSVISVRAPQGTHLDETDRIARMIEERIEPFRRTPDGYLRIKNIVTTVGAGGGNPFEGGDGTGSHLANVKLIFPDFEVRQDPDGTDWTSAGVIANLRSVLNDIPGAEIRVEKQKNGPPTGAAVTVRFIGEDMKVLQQLSKQAMHAIKDVPNLVNLSSDLEAEKPELNFIPDRKRAAKLGISAAVISNFLKTAVFGTKVADYREFTDEYDIRLRLPLGERKTIDDILRLRVPTDDGKAVPISSLGKFEYQPGLGTIHRINRKRAVTLTADAEGRLGPEVLVDVEKRLAALTMPDGYRIEYAGEKEEEEKNSKFLLKAFGLALLLIVGILVAQFNTLSAPLIIMTTVLLSMIGVFVGLLVTDMPFGIVMTGVGVISLAGVVVNNAIVLLDYTRQLQRRGHTLLQAVVEAGVTRLRPVLLTAGTTVLGLVPMATGISFDFHTMQWATRSSSSQWWASMANAVIYGLGFATLLTLVVVPSLYVLIYRAAAKFGFGGLKKPDDAEHPHPKPMLEDF